MSPFILDVSAHAHERLKQRKITRFAVRLCLARGRLVTIDINGRRTNRMKFGSRELECVYLQKKSGYVLVTAYWRSVWP